MIAKIFNSRIFLIILSIILAVILFMNATFSTTQDQGISTNGGQSFTTNLTNIPINIQYDDTKYFISGYSGTASVTLTSYNQIALLQEKSTDMRTFKLVSDLTKLSVGTHKVPITIENLANSVHAKTDPTTITVNIENKAIKTVSIVPVVDESLIPKGYSFSWASLSDYYVNVTAGTSSIKDIAKVEAVWPSGTDLTQNTTQTVSLVAVNAKDQIVSARFSKSTVKMTVEIKKTTTSSSNSVRASSSSSS